MGYGSELGQGRRQEVECRRSTDLEGYQWREIETTKVQDMIRGVAENDIPTMSIGSP